MKTEGQIRQKLKQVLYRKLQRRMKDNFKQKPDTCGFNRKPYHIEPDDPGRSRPAASPAVCIHHDRGGWICDEMHGGVDLARECPFWISRQTKDEIRAQFAEDYRDLVIGSRRGEKHPEFPVASALMWVLGDDLPEPPPMESETPSEGGSKSSTGDEDDEEGEPPADPIVRSSWDHPAWPWNWFR